MDKHQWIALALLVSTLFVVLLDATRAFGVAEPGLAPAVLPAEPLQQSPGPMLPVIDQGYAVRKSFA